MIRLITFDSTPLFSQKTILVIQKTKKIVK